MYYLCYGCLVPTPPLNLTHILSIRLQHPPSSPTRTPTAAKYCDCYPISADEYTLFDALVSNCPIA
ncbi:hypothetical protein H9L39_11591 [Fusarium oxysporum f. sp. albedinis]|nr:hypothetical protein H9L39_11591 [Fusarium oxysporum f. sp. albedinis]